MKSIKIPIYNIGNRNHELLACSAVPQPTSYRESPTKICSSTCLLKLLLFSLFFFLKITEVQIFVSVKWIESILQDSRSLHVLIVDLQAVLYVHYVQLEIIYMHV
jgi:hypothetical protein